LLRLLLPLSDKVYLTSHAQLKEAHGPEGSPDHSNRYERRAVCTKSRDMLSTRWWLMLTRSSSFKIYNCKDLSQARFSLKRLPESSQTRLFLLRKSV